MNPDFNEQLRQISEQAAQAEAHNSRVLLVATFFMLTVFTVYVWGLVKFLNWVWGEMFGKRPVRVAAPERQKTGAELFDEALAKAKELTPEPRPESDYMPKG